MTDRYLVVGLGNPGPKYINTRHNIGFQCVEAIAAEYGLTFDKTQAKARVASGAIAQQSLMLVKPQTFMNLSGSAVGGIAHFYKVPPERVLVIHDDLDIPLGTLRLRKAGGAGGHNGMKSVIQHLGTQAFPRLRFGIGRPPGRMDPAAFVLRPFKQEEEPLVIETVARVVRAIHTWLTEGIEKAMSQHNGTAEQAANAQRQNEAQANALPEVSANTSENEELA